MAARLTLRAAHIAEAATLAAMGYSAWESSMRHILEAEDSEERAVEMEELRWDFLAFCVGAVDSITVAEQDGVVAGWGAREPFNSYISDLWVSPDHQRAGVGHAILGALERDIFNAGHDASHLETHAENGGAIRFYAREGYRIVWRGFKFSRLLGYRIEKVRMEKPLTVAAH